MKIHVVTTVSLFLALSACNTESNRADLQGSLLETQTISNTAPKKAVEPSQTQAQQLIETQPGCITCHSLEPGVTSVGPSVATIGAEAGSRVSGTSAEEYLRESILEPDAHVAEGFAAGIMPKGFATALTEQQVNDLVAYMLTLR